MKINSVLTLVLAALFYSCLMFAKHDPALSKIIPFGDDPYDAVGSFAVIVAGLIAILALVRAFRPYYGAAPAPERKIFLARAQVAIVLAVLVTLAADLVAMLRHRSVWWGSPASNELAAGLAGLALLAALLGFFIRRSLYHLELTSLPRAKRKAAAISLAAVVILACYPEGIITHLSGHLFTVLVGDALLFAPMGALTIAMVPYAAEQHAGAPLWFLARKIQWVMAAAVGLTIGVIAFLGEISEGSSLHGLRFILLATVFISLGTAGLLLAFVFLRHPLGLSR